MEYLVVAVVALLASALTFFSGFGLGTLLLPAFALFFPVEQAIAMTAVVHLLNALFKALLVGRHADRGVVLRFGLPAIAAALLGAWLLGWLSGAAPARTLQLGGIDLEVVPVKLVIGVLLLGFTAIELVPRLRGLSFSPRWLPLGGALSGFFGGLSGLQGALRSAFLSRAGLDARAFIGTGVVIAALVDLSRLGVYAGALRAAGPSIDVPLLATAVAAAFAGALLGRRYLAKATMPGLQRLVGALLVLVALGLISGVL